MSQGAERLKIVGRYVFECYGADGRLKWREIIDNTVVTVGKNLALNTFLAGSGYTVTGPYMGLISSTSFSAISASDTMSSHAGWLEAGNANTPTYSGLRPTCAWSAASGGVISLSAPLAFTFTGNGTVEGGFIVYGTGASSAIDNTSGTLFSAGIFAAGAKPVTGGDILNVSYTLTLA